MALLYVLLVLIWSTGFITGKFLVGLIDPNIYLTIRFLGVGGLFTLIAVFQRRRFPSWNELPKHIIAWMLMNGFYLAFAYVAIAKGLPCRYHGADRSATDSVSHPACLLTDQRKNLDKRHHRNADWYGGAGVGLESSF